MSQSLSGDDSSSRRDIYIGIALIAAAIPFSGWVGGIVSGRSGGAESIVFEVGLSVFGLALSAVGFWFSITEIIKARKKADDISNAVSGIKKQIGAFDVITELGICKSSVVVAADLINSRDWARAAVHYNVIRVCLVKMISIKSNIGDDRLASMRDYLFKISSRCDELDALNSGEIDSISRSDFISDLRGLEVVLIEGELAQKDGLNV